MFEKGDVVTLKSGGPEMTVTEISDFGDGEKILCTWFDKNQKLEAAFEPETLVKEDPHAPIPFTVG